MLEIYKETQINTKKKIRDLSHREIASPDISDSHLPPPRSASEISRHLSACNTTTQHSSYNMQPIMSERASAARTARARADPPLLHRGYADWWSRRQREAKKNQVAIRCLTRKVDRGIWNRARKCKVYHHALPSLAQTHSPLTLSLSLVTNVVLSISSPPTGQGLSR